MTWCLVYIGYRIRLCTDPRSAFISKDWKLLTNEIQLRQCSIDVHSPLGMADRYCEPLRSIIQKTRLTRSTLEPQYVLEISRKAMNDTTSGNVSVQIGL